MDAARRRLLLKQAIGPDEFPVDQQFQVLLVEDDIATLKYVELLLRKCNYTVVTARNGREAIEILDGAPGRIDLILTDMAMPEMSGLELIVHVSRADKWRGIPVVAMSAQDAQSNVLEAFEAGVADYLIKPVRKNELTTLWQHVWRTKRLHGLPVPANALFRPVVLHTDANKLSSGASTSTHDQSLAPSRPAPVYKGVSVQGDLASIDTGASRRGSLCNPADGSINFHAIGSMLSAVSAGQRAFIDPGRATGICEPVSEPAIGTGGAKVSKPLPAVKCAELPPPFKLRPRDGVIEFSPGISRPVAEKSSFGPAVAGAEPAVALPLGLQELAALGQRRQLEREHQLQRLQRREHHEEQQKRQNAQQQRLFPPANEAGAKQDSITNLRHSECSAFTAFTVASRAQEDAPDTDNTTSAVSTEQQDTSSNEQAQPMSVEGGVAGAVQLHDLQRLIMQHLPEPVKLLLKSLQQHTQQQQEQQHQQAHQPQQQQNGMALLPEAVALAVAKGGTTHRQFALAKYLEKKSRRNFEKKVRYESRKRLAEARPRVRGQFVKQDASTKDGEDDAKRQCLEFLEGTPT